MRRTTNVTSQSLRPTRSARIRHARFLPVVLLFPTLTGCLVPQPRGQGLESRVREPQSGADYFLYLPEQYVQNNGIHPHDPNRRWPLVVTFHGMKPYDTWDRQIHEWQEQADAYGFIVCAPWLQTCDSFMEFPLRNEHAYVLRDKDAVMAIIDHVLANYRADPDAVLSTSWSSGGFMAHYIPNRFPHRFRCIATRLSNFSPDILTDATVPMYRNMPVAVFIGESDFPACITQSQQAVAWYKARGFTHVESKMIDGMGHSRIPQTAAAFFARQLGIEPFKPYVAVQSLSRLRMRDWEPPPDLLAAMAPQPTLTDLYAATRGGPPRTGAGTNGRSERASGGGSLLVPAPRDERKTAPPVMGTPQPAMGDSGSPRPVRAPTQDNVLYRPRNAGPRAYPVSRITGGAVRADAVRPVSTAPPRNSVEPVGIRLVGPSVGDCPLQVAFSTDLPADQTSEAEFVWKCNDAVVCNSQRGVKRFDQPGEYTLSVFVLTRDGRELRGATRIHALSPDARRAP